MYEVLFFAIYICLVLIVFYSFIKLIDFLSILYLFEKRQLEGFEKIKDRFIVFCKRLEKSGNKEDVDIVLKPFLNEIKGIVMGIESIPFSIKTVLMFSIKKSAERVISIFFNKGYNENKKKQLVNKEIKNSVFYEMSLSYVYASLLKFTFLTILSGFLVIYYFHTFYLYFKFRF